MFTTCSEIAKTWVDEEEDKRKIKLLKLDLYTATAIPEDYGWK